MQKSPFSTVYFVLGYFWFHQSFASVDTVLCMQSSRLFWHVPTLVIVEDKSPLIIQSFAEMVNRNILTIELALLSQHILMSHVQRPEPEPPPQIQCQWWYSVQLIPELFTLMTPISQDDVQNNLVHCALYHLFPIVGRIWDENVYQVLNILILPLLMNPVSQDDAHSTTELCPLNHQITVDERHNRTRSSLYIRVEFFLGLVQLQLWYYFTEE